MGHFQASPHNTPTQINSNELNKKMGNLQHRKAYLWTAASINSMPKIVLDFL